MTVILSRARRPARVTGRPPVRRNARIPLRSATTRPTSSGPPPRQGALLDLQNGVRGLVGDSRIPGRKSFVAAAVASVRRAPRRARCPPRCMPGSAALRQGMPPMCVLAAVHATVGEVAADIARIRTFGRIAASGTDADRSCSVISPRQTRIRAGRLAFSDLPRRSARGPRKWVETMAALPAMQEWLTLRDCRGAG